ncbi:MAG: hypothetical protein IH932_03290 [Thaumarchaeota archaeon]|nr:hypothetical protein [Nitrososphaerota archaeon]
MVSIGLEALDSILGDGLPSRSSNLIIGPPGIGKEGIWYRFLDSGSNEGDACLSVSKQATRDLLDDAKGFGVKVLDNVTWLDCSGVQSKVSLSGDLGKLTDLSINIKKFAAENQAKKIRVAFDILSPLLLLHPVETIYKFLGGLLAELKNYETVFLATIEEGMHSTKDVVVFEQLFDGTIEMKLYEEGLKIIPLLRIKKMRGTPPKPKFFSFKFLPSGGMEINAYND